MRHATAKRARFPVVLAVISLVWMSSNAAAQGLNIESQDLGSGKAAKYIRVDLGHFDVRVISPLVSLGGQAIASNPERAPQGLSLLEYLIRYGALAVMSGGYIDTYSPPTALGFVKSNGTLVAPPRNSWLTNGLFCSDEGRAVIQSGIPDNFRDCLQAGPVLLSGGHVSPQSNNPGYAKLAQSVQEQGFICLDSQSRVVLGVSDKINLQTLVDFLSRPEIDCKYALRLTGLSTAGLRDRSGLVIGHDDYLFPSAIGVFAKK
jgi:hypothetical protein